MSLCCFDESWRVEVPFQSTYGKINTFKEGKASFCFTDSRNSGWISEAFICAKEPWTLTDYLAGGGGGSVSECLGPERKAQLVRGTRAPWAAGGASLQKLWGGLQKCRSGWRRVFQARNSRSKVLKEGLSRRTFWQLGWDLLGWSSSQPRHQKELQEWSGE